MSSLREFLTNIANAIRNKKGTTAPINAQNFASEIESIETGGESFIYKGLEKRGTDWSYAFYVFSSYKNLFYYMTELKESDFPPSSNVTNMSNMFYGCSNLTTIPQLNTSNVTSMNFMFYGCSNLIMIPQLDTSKVTSMNNMFNKCNNLITIPKLDTSNVTNMTNMFYQCYKVQKIDISKYNIIDTSSSSSMFGNCHSLKQVIIRNFGNYTLNSNAFYECYHLTGTVNETYNPNGDKDCYIYVPKDMFSTLLSATNWSTYADQMRVLEDYTVDGTTTGELDYLKISH